MPSSRAILADINNYGLDPTKAHTQTHAHGRLSKTIGASVEVLAPVVEVVTEPVEVETVPIEVPVEPVELKVEEEEVPELPEVQESDAVVVSTMEEPVAVPKKRFGKKNQ